MPNLDALLELTADELVRLVLHLRAELENAQMKLGLARVAIADSHAALKRKSRALRHVEAQRRSLRQTVKRRRKYAR
jgi:hypothetical protein